MKTSQQLSHEFLLGILTRAINATDRASTDGDEDERRPVHTFSHDFGDSDSESTF